MSMVSGKLVLPIHSFISPCHRNFSNTYYYTNGTAKLTFSVTTVFVLVSFFASMWDGTQGFAHAWQALYH
jgi:hypothetical protein